MTSSPYFSRNSTCYPPSPDLLFLVRDRRASRTRLTCSVISLNLQWLPHVLWWIENGVGMEKLSKQFRFLRGRWIMNPSFNMRWWNELYAKLVTVFGMLFSTGYDMTLFPRSVYLFRASDNAVFGYRVFEDGLRHPVDLRDVSFHCTLDYVCSFLTGILFAKQEDKTPKMYRVSNPNIVGGGTEITNTFQQNYKYIHNVLQRSKLYCKCFFMKFSKVVLFSSPHKTCKGMKIKKYSHCKENPPHILLHIISQIDCTQSNALEYSHRRVFL